MKAIQYEKDAVLIQDGKIKAWVDVVVENGKLRYGWNKYIFYLWNKEDRVLSKWQDKAHNFEDATNLAVETLLNLEIIYLDDDGYSNEKWYQTEKYHQLKGSHVLE